MSLLSSIHAEGNGKGAMRSLLTGLVQESSVVVAEDIQDILWNRREDFLNPETIGSAMKPTTPLSGFTVLIKKLSQSNCTTPDLPRVRTGLLASAISSRGSDLRAEVFINDPNAAEYGVKQQEGFIASKLTTTRSGEKNYGHAVPARPFFGVSDIALLQIKRRASDTAKELETAFQSFGSNTFSFTVSI